MRLGISSARQIQSALFSCFSVTSSHGIRAWIASIMTHVERLLQMFAVVSQTVPLQYSSDLIWGSNCVHRHTWKEGYYKTHNPTCIWLCKSVLSANMQRFCSSTNTKYWLKHSNNRKPQPCMPWQSVLLQKWAKKKLNHTSQTV